MSTPAWTISHQVIILEVGKVLHSLNILIKTGLDSGFHSDPYTYRSTASRACERPERNARVLLRIIIGVTRYSLPWPFRIEAMLALVYSQYEFDSLDKGVILRITSKHDLNCVIDLYLATIDPNPHVCTALIYKAENGSSTMPSIPVLWEVCAGLYV